MREQFWKHMEQVEPLNKSKSILLFGAVAKEHHAQSEKAVLRDEHHHTPTCTSKQHYWNPVAKRSLEAYGVKLHAACHDGYTAMYFYIRHTSAKMDALAMFPLPSSSKSPHGCVCNHTVES